MSACWFLADRTISRAYGTVSRLSVVCRLSVCDVLYCGKTVRPSQKVSEGCFCLIFARTAKESVLDGRN